MGVRSHESVYAGTDSGRFWRGVARPGPGGAAASRGFAHRFQPEHAVSGRDTRAPVIESLRLNRSHAVGRSAGFQPAQAVSQRKR